MFFGNAIFMGDFVKDSRIIAYITVDYLFATANPTLILFALGTIWRTWLGWLCSPIENWRDEDHHGLGRQVMDIFDNLAVVILKFLLCELAPLNLNIPIFKEHNVRV